MKSKGILQLHFHLPNGNSFLRMHKPSKFGDYLLGFRYTVKEVIKTKKPVVGFEVGKYFEGFRYVFPIKDGEKYLGSVEVSISSQKFIQNMNKYLDGNFVMILKKSYADDIMGKETLKNNFHKTCFSDKYYMNNLLHGKKKLNKTVIKRAKSKFAKELEEHKTFAVHNFDFSNGHHIFIFKNLVNFQQEHIGYSIQIIQDTRIEKILMNSILKFLMIFIAFLLIFYFYKKSKKNEVFLEQFKEFVDKMTLVSKTDLQCFRF